VAQNIEIKARATDFNQQQEIAHTNSDTPLEVIHQCDTFFNVPHGRLKLRVLTSDLESSTAQLIFYHRADQSGPKLSDYQINEIQDPTGLKPLLSEAYGVCAQVNKTRHLYMSGRTRIHFDDVEDLGHFIELEVVLREREPIEQAEQEANALMQLLKIKEPDLIHSAYADLLNAKNSE